MSLGGALTAVIADAPQDLGPLAVLFRAFHSVEALLEGNRPFSLPRQAIISVTPALQEREHTKLAALADALATALEARGGGAPAGPCWRPRTGMAAFVYATVAWLDEPEPRSRHAPRSRLGRAASPCYQETSAPLPRVGVEEIRRDRAHPLTITAPRSQRASTRLAQPAPQVAADDGEGHGEQARRPRPRRPKL